jgi:hypothetical protein
MITHRNHKRSRRRLSELAKTGRIREPEAIHRGCRVPKTAEPMATRMKARRKHRSMRFSLD